MNFVVNLAVILLMSELAGALPAGMNNRIRIKRSSELIVDNGNDSDSSESYTIEKMELLAKKRKGLILDIKRFLREAKSIEQKAELSLRLGSFYMEDYHALLSQAQAKRDANQSGSSEELEAKSSLEKSLAIYQGLITRYPDHPRADEMLYALGMASLDRAKVETAMSYFQKVITLNSKSKFAEDAYLQLGDYYFDKNNYSKSLEYFESIIRSKNPRLMTYAVYKKAWCLFNQQNFPQSIAHFKWVVKNQSKNSNVRVRSEAIRDIALPFAESRNVKDAIEFYSNLDTAQNRSGLEIIAEMLLDGGAFKESMELNARLLAMDPNWKSNPRYEIGIIEALNRSNQRVASIERLFTRLPLYSQDSTWYEINSGNPAAVSDLNEKFETTARKYALQCHADGQRTKNAELYASAKTLYGKYLDHFPLTVHAPKIRFYLAEILFKQKQFLQAAENYYAVFKNKASGELRQDALRFSLSSYDRLINTDRKSRGLAEIASTSNTKIAANEKIELQPYSETETRFFEIGDEYLSQFPTETDAPDVLYEQAYLRYSHHDLAKAQPLFWSVIKRFPKHETATSSAFLILDILNRSQDYQNLVEICKKFLQHRELGKLEFKEEVAVVLRQTELKRISLLETKGDYRQAAELYVEYTKAYGADDESNFEKALYNAGVNFTKADMPIQAVDVQERFLRRFPKSGLRGNLLLSVARTYETLANFDKSALYYDEFAHDYPKNNQAKSALRLSGLYYWGAGHHRKAENILAEYRTLYPNDDKLIQKDIIDIYESQNSTRNLVNFYLEERARRGTSPSEYLILSFKVADIQLKSKGRISKQLMSEIENVATTRRAQLIKTPGGVDAYSRFAFSKVNQTFEQFSRLHLSGKNMEGTLKTKMNLLKALENDFTNIARLRTKDWGIASIYKTALAYHQMSLEVSQAPVPGELNSEQIDIYRKELTDQMIKPFTEKARVLSKTCLDKSIEFNVISPWVSRCYSLAAELSPEMYPSVRTFYLPPLHIAVNLPSEGFKTPIGDFRTFSYPYFSTFLFQPPTSESVALQLPELQLSGIESRGGLRLNVPSIIDYRALSNDRKSVLTQLFRTQKSAEGELPSFSFLNTVRALNGQKASTFILRSIQNDPTNSALHNLLALSYLEQGSLAAAKVVWLSLIARGEITAALYNNLGVVAWMESRESVAEEYWREASSMDNSREASLNLGALALKYRNGFEARKHFERALSKSEQDASGIVGLAVAQLQNGEIDQARDKLYDAAKQFKSDPYARLSISYVLTDIDKKPGAAGQMLTQFLDNNDNSVEIRQALSEAKRSLSTTSGKMGIPTIESLK